MRRLLVAMAIALAASPAQAIEFHIKQEGLRLGARNLFVCASAFNARALRFYERHGFRPVARLPGLVADDYQEILLRKFPL